MMHPVWRDSLLDNDARVLECLSLAYAHPEADVDLEPPPGHRGPVPRGLAFLAALSEGLEGQGYQVPHGWVIPGGHGLEIRGKGRRFDLTLSAGDLQQGQWTLRLEVRRGLLPWRRKAGGPALARLGDHLTELIQADPQVTLGL